LLSELVSIVAVAKPTLCRAVRREIDFSIF